MGGIRKLSPLLVLGTAAAAVLNTPKSTLPPVGGGGASVGFLGVVTPTARPPVLSPELDEWRKFEGLRGGLDSDRYKEFFSSRPQLVAARLAKVTSTLYAAKQDWEASASEGLVNGEKSAEFDPTKDVRGELPGEGRGARLCEFMSSLGPVSVKICQTLSQRPDLVGDEAATALKRLQTSNVAYSNELAWAVVREERNWSGPIAPGVGERADDPPGAPTLFAEITADPIAVASLGQVYKATTHEGVEVAVKVQRPDAMAILATDYLCFVVAWSAVELSWKLSKGGFDNGDVQGVVDRVAADILDELDYEKEAKNAAEFEESLGFLGFVGVPPVVPEYSSKRVLVTEWVQGQHLDMLPEAEGLKMTRMAVEACTASLVLTGFVHADPHEGNLMLADDGRVIFLDFGLMSDVSPSIMEAFARGIQACLAEDYVTLAKAFKETGFVTDPVQFKPENGTSWQAFGVDAETGEDLGLAQFSTELADAMQSTEGGTSRFGALATVLNQKLAPRWKMFTPPYVLLLIRTFLTLEGIAARVDPDFNIYEMAMPWAVRRSLSPGSAEGIATLRSTFLTSDNRVQWERLLELVEEGSKGADEPAKALTADQSAKARSNEAAKASAMNDAVGSLLGSPEGAALRRALRDLDSTDLLVRLVSTEARALRHAAALAVCGAITSPWAAKLARRIEHMADPPMVMEVLDKVERGGAKGDAQDGAVVSAADAARPVSDGARRLRQRQNRWKRKVAVLLVASHFKRQLQRGGQGAKALASLAYLLVRVVAGAIRQAALAVLRTTVARGGRRVEGGEEEGGAGPVPA